jgi:hypothetical protein
MGETFPDKEEAMIDQMFDNFRKASEASLQLQQDMIRQFTQQWIYNQPVAGGAATDWGRAFQRRLFEMTIDTLNRQRESLDSAYKSGIQVLEQTYQASEARSPEEQRRKAEEIWRRLFDSFKNQQETQFQEFQKWTEKSFEFAQGTPPPAG